MIIATVIGFLLIIIGLWGMLSQKNLIKIIIGFSILDTGIHVVMVSIGYIKDRVAPILDSAVKEGSGFKPVVDPVPSALVLTAIVIGLAVTALMLSYAIRMYNRKKSLSIDDYKESQC